MHYNVISIIYVYIKYYIYIKINFLDSDISHKNATSLDFHFIVSKGDNY